MKILALYEKNITRYFLPDDDGYFLDTYIKILRERIESKDFYKGNDLIAAQTIVDTYSASLDLDAFEILDQQAVRFLDFRSIFEYEDWDIVDTEN